MADDGAMHRGLDTRPIPDPTEKTIESQLREQAWLEKLLNSRLEGIEKAFEKSEKVTDKAVDRLQNSQEMALRGLVGQLSDLTVRVARFEEGKTGAQTGYQNVVTMVGLLFAIVLGIAGIFLNANNRGPEPTPPPIVINVPAASGSPAMTGTTTTTQSPR